jgi:hypothetical protein
MSLGPSTRRVWIIAAFVLLLALPPRAEACLFEYRSIDWQIAHSRLVVLAEVVSVDPTGEKPRRSGPREYVPSIATLRILRVFKGDYDKTEVRVRSGPIRSCLGDHVHVSFQVGKRAIYILPGFPIDGEAGLVWGRSVRDLAETGLVESTVSRLQAYRQSYLDSLRRDRPETFKSANELYEEMSKGFVEWPAAQAKIFHQGELMGAESFFTDDKASAAATERSLSKTLGQFDLEAIRGAMALDWLSDAPIPWSQHPVWESAVARVSKAKADELETLELHRIRKLLDQAGVEEAQVETLLDSVKENSRYKPSLEFPPVTPDLRKVDITTDFILRYFAYNRGMMVPAYAPDFSAEMLAGLDPVRAKPYVAALYGCDDERLRWLASQAIGYSDSAEYSDIVLEDIMENGRDWAWKVLDHHKSRETTGKKLAGMVEYGLKSYTTWGIDAMWRSLAEGKCFHPAVIEKAVAMAEELESKQKKGAKSKKGNAADEEEPTAKRPAVYDYLDAAMAPKDTKPTSTRTAAEYRAWWTRIGEKQADSDDEDDGE